MKNLFAAFAILILIAQCEEKSIERPVCCSFPPIDTSFVFLIGLEDTLGNDLLDDSFENAYDTRRIYIYGLDSLGRENRDFCSVSPEDYKGAPFADQNDYFLLTRMKNDSLRMDTYLLHVSDLDIDTIVVNWKNINTYQAEGIWYNKDYHEMLDTGYFNIVRIVKDSIF